ncbi:chaplin [Streptomyces sioyaensis]|uniref:chaplin n=1 Tax=Streptomyces sioyaensis TaxID=67364 RepID=UPI003EBFB829
MRQSLKACVFVVAASGALGANCGAAYADAGAGGGTTNSPGVLSGNSIQLTVDTPVNACGNTVDAGAALNPAFGNGCGNGAPPTMQQPPPGPRPPQAEGAPGVHWRTAGPAKHAEPVQRPGPERAERPAPVPAPVAHAPRPAPRPAPDARVDEVARAGTSAGSALAATGPAALSALAGTGGGLLLGGVLLLRRARPRRR